MMLTFEKEGFEARTVKLDTKSAPAAFGTQIANLLILPIIGIPIGIWVDKKNGALRSFTPDPINVDLATGGVADVKEDDADA